MRKRPLDFAGVAAALLLAVAASPALAGDQLRVLAAAESIEADDRESSTRTETRKSSHGHYQAPPLETLGGPFELTDHTGRPVSDKTFLGGWWLAFIGFMSCGDVCPVALQTMAIAYDEMAPEQQKKLQLVFMDFDDDRADLKKLGKFVGQFHPAIVGLTGTRRQTWAMLRAFKVRREHGGRYYPVPTDVARGMGDPSKGILRQASADGRITHTSRMYLVGPDGKVKAIYYHDVAPTDLSSKILAHMAK
jgi:protein SCO1/2